MIPDAALLSALEPTAERLYERHLAATKAWMPHEYVPWSRGRDFAPGEIVDEEATGLSEAVRSALLVNLLTEDNLPYYTSVLLAMFGEDSVWGAWTRQWTAEENRHSVVLRDYLVVTRSLDPTRLEHARMQQMCGGAVPRPPGAANAIAYVALQELATRVSHRNTGRFLDDPAGVAVLGRVANDENLHYLFYKDLGAALLELDPAGFLAAIEHEVRHFEMPGTGIADFTAHARRIAKAGIYDFLVHHDQVLEPVLVKQWGLDRLQGLTPDAEATRDRILTHLGRVKAAGERMARRAEPAPA